MSVLQRLAKRPFPSYIMHPQHYDQPENTFLADKNLRKLERYPSRCKGHIGTNVLFHTDQEGYRSYILEVVLEQGSFLIEAPCTYSPAMGMDLLDGNLVKDAEEWVLFQQLRLKPVRLEHIFGRDDRLDCEEYVRKVTAPHVGPLFQDVKPEFLTASPQASEPVKNALPSEKRNPESPDEQADRQPQSTPQQAVAPEKPWWKFW
jgi:hypothetical protein